MKAVRALVERLERDSYGSKPEWEVLSVGSGVGVGTYLIEVKKVEGENVREA